MMSIVHGSSARVSRIRDVVWRQKTQEEKMKKWNANLWIKYGQSHAIIKNKKRINSFSCYNFCSMLFLCQFYLDWPSGSILNIVGDMSVCPFLNSMVLVALLCWSLPVTPHWPYVHSRVVHWALQHWNEMIGPFTTNTFIFFLKSYNYIAFYQMEADK